MIPSRARRWSVLAAVVALAVTLVVVVIVASGDGDRESRRAGPVVERLEREERAAGSPVSVTSTTTRARPPRASTPTTLPATTAPSTVAPTSSPTSAPRPSGGLPALTVGDPRPEGYDRDAFGSNWINADRDCQDTRAEVLIAESRIPVTFSDGSCRVAGGEWLDPWSGAVTTTAGTLDVDHTVPLANAWRSGAWAWPPALRLAFANDLEDPWHLIAIPAGENRSKVDDGPEAWRPPSRASWCLYARVWSAIKARWNLTVTRTELAALNEMASTC